MGIELLELLEYRFDPNEQNLEIIDVAQIGFLKVSFESQNLSEGNANIRLSGGSAQLIKFKSLLNGSELHMPDSMIFVPDANTYGEILLADPGLLDNVEIDKEP